jgi:glycosyltransferase involved in cell wall biosynthesis
MSIPTISVVTITYNQECFIEQSVKSVLQQQTLFPIEYIIADDCSTDGTPAILRRLLRENPGAFTLLQRDRNLGLARNFRDSYNSASGQYIALLEGDDYWTDPLKLQCQFDLMESRPDCSICFHVVEYVDESGKPLGRRHPNEFKEAWELGDVMRSNPVQTCSIVVRRSMVPQLPEFFLRLKLGDWPLCVLAARRGPLLCLEPAMAAYRVNGESTWTGKSNAKKHAEIAAMFLCLAVEYPDLLNHVEKIFRNQTESFVETIDELREENRTLRVVQKWQIKGQLARLYLSVSARLFGKR